MSWSVLAVVAGLVVTALWIGSPGFRWRSKAALSAFGVAVLAIIIATEGRALSILNF